MSRFAQWSIALLVVFNAVLFAAIVNLGAFAAKGPRFTADDGARERAERIASDQALAARIDLLHNLLAEQESLLGLQAQ